MRGISPYRAALVAQLVLLLYFELCVLVPLGAWNDQASHSAGLSSGNIALGSAIGVAQLLLLIGTIWRSWPLLWLGLVGDTTWLALHAWGIWVPYVFGASPGYSSMYFRVFARTTKLLPNFGSHLAPDAMHIFIDVFLALVIITLVRYMLFLWRARADED